MEIQLSPKDMEELSTSVANKLKESITRNAIHSGMYKLIEEQNKTSAKFWLESHVPKVAISEVFETVLRGELRTILRDMIGEEVVKAFKDDEGLRKAIFERMIQSSEFAMMDLKERLYREEG